MQGIFYQTSLSSLLQVAEENSRSCGFKERTIPRRQSWRIDNHRNKSNVRRFLDLKIVGSWEYFRKKYCMCLSYFHGILRYLPKFRSEYIVVSSTFPVFLMSFIQQLVFYQQGIPPPSTDLVIISQTLTNLQQISSIGGWGVSEPGPDARLWLWALQHHHTWGSADNS